MRYFRMHLILKMGSGVESKGVGAENVNWESVPAIESLSLTAAIEILCIK